VIVKASFTAPPQSFTISTKELSAVVQAGCWYYEWQVRARDGAGNWGNFGEARSFIGTPMVSTPASPTPGTPGGPIF
jgi:hypothetical protein